MLPTHVIVAGCCLDVERNKFDGDAEGEKIHDCGYSY